MCPYEVVNEYEQNVKLYLLAFMPLLNRTVEIRQESIFDWIKGDEISKGERMGIELGSPQAKLCYVSPH